MSNFLKKAIVFLMVFIIAFGGIQVMAAEATDEKKAEEIPAEIQAIIDDCAKLPVPDDVTAEHGELIVKVKSAYDKLERSDKALIGSENVTKLSVAYTAYLPYLIGGIVEKLEALPKKIKDKHKDQLVEIYDEYSLLTTEEKDSLDPELVKKYEDGLRKVAPELLGEDAITEETPTDTKAEKVEIFGMYIWELALVAFIALVICFNVFLIVYTAIKLFKEAK